MSSQTETIIEVRKLFKHYPKVKAVNGIDLKISKGVCFGLLGPNGAGKTTTVEIMEGITKPTSGQILFYGAPIGSDFKEKSGIQFQATALQDYLTSREVLKLFQSFYKNPARIEDLSKLCALDEFLDQDTHSLSGGQRQRVLLAIALINNPDIIFLDEPTTGLDPQARRNFWDLINIIKSQKKTVVMTTHYMEEAYVLCDEIAIMDQGSIIAQGAPNGLLRQHFNGVTLELPSRDFSIQESQAPGHWKIARKADLVEIYTNEVDDCLKFLINSGVSLSHLKIRSQTLEDLFLQLTGKEYQA